MLDRLVPGYKDKIWARLSNETKERYIARVNDKFEKDITAHKSWQPKMTAYKATESKFVPSPKFRKIAVDWRRQMARGTMHAGRWYEGPPVEGSNRPSDYTPGNTRDRLQDVRAPFSEAEWEQRKNYRSFDLVHFSYGMLFLFIAYRLTGEWPVVWCEEEEQ